MQLLKRTTVFCLVFLVSVWCYGTTGISIVPRPMEIKEGKGTFTVQPDTKVFIDSGNKELRNIAKLIVHKISLSGGPALEIYNYIPGKKLKNAILITLHNADTALGKEGYSLNISKKQVIIRSLSGNGLFYGTQSLFQLFPPEIERNSELKIIYKLPVLSIRDMPRYPYRGMHLDVSRHFFPVTFIKEYIDLMAMYKMNNFHWHLTDDQGWRIQIKKYPRLTQVGSSRIGTKIGKTSMIDSIPYGGFYTQDQVKELVTYAADKYVNIIPEIEMPGHSVAALTAYPNLSCTGGPFRVRTEWGVADDILCAGNDSSFTFVQDVLSEVIELFPSTFIHIGGDEAPKVRWKECTKCQARITTEGLANELELQSYFIKRVERFLNSKGRRLIGWDEILEGGLAPEATVMSWRGIQGGIEAAQQNHDVIMTPGDYCYFDHYQADPATEPLAFGGYLTLKTVYSFEPTPPVLSADQAKHILGAQGNVWTEYILTQEGVEYMAYPRAIALAEVNWSQKETRNWDDFSNRMDNQYKRLGYKGVNYCKGAYEVEITTIRDTMQNRNLILLSTESKGFNIHYTTDGSDPSAKSSLYQEPIEVNKDCIVKACLVKDGIVTGKINERTIVLSLASGKPVIFLKPYSFKYPASGNNAMTDGLIGTSILKSGWQGYEGTDMEFVIDLIKPSSFSRISTTFIQNIGSWVLYPVDVTFSTSTDGQNWDMAGNLHTDPLPTKGKAEQEFLVTFPTLTARYIKIYAKNNGVLPEWHEYKGGKSWIFADEVIVK